MAHHENPAGRLHELLTAFEQQGGVSTQAAWSAVLGVSEEEVPLYLADVAILLREVRDRARETGEDAFDPISGHVIALSQSIFPVSSSFGSKADRVAPDPSAMQALKMLSVVLERDAPEGTVPNEDEIEGLRASVGDLIVEVSASDLPVVIKQALLRRLADMLAAIEHVRTKGPDGVRRAAEALAMSAELYEGEGGDEDGLFTRLKSFAQRSWFAFNLATTVASAVLTWERFVDIPVLDPGQDPPQLSPGASPEPHDDYEADDPSR